MNFSNGITVTSLQELSDVMPNITGPTFRHHVTKDKNDIADWIRDAVKDNDLSDKIRAAKTTEEFVKILEEDKAKNNKLVDADDASEQPAATVQPASASVAISITSSATAPSAAAPSVALSAEQKPQINEQVSIQTSQNIASSAQPTLQAAAQAVTQSNPPLGIPTDIINESLLWKDLKNKIEQLDVDEKIKILEKSEQKYPADLNVKFSLALLYHKKKIYDQAERRYKEILQIYPTNTKAMYYLGGLLKSQKRYDEALAYLNNYAAIKRDDQKVNDLIAKINSHKK